jgi:hypothetical protein
LQPTQRFNTIFNVFIKIRERFVPHQNSMSSSSLRSFNWFKNFENKFSIGDNEFAIK